METKTLTFNSLEELQNYFGTKDVTRMDVREAAETKYAAKSILAALQENDAPGIVTNFWYILLRLAEERLKALGYKVMDICLDGFINLVHIVPADLMRAHPHIIARQMFEDVSDSQLNDLLDQALDQKPLNKDFLNMLRIEYVRRHKLN